eukprot:gene6149-8476_t
MYSPCTKSYQNLIEEVVGKVQLESLDPKWMDLFRKDIYEFIYEVNDQWLTWMCYRLAENNPSTRNFLQLLTQTTTLIHQIVKHPHISISSVKICCNAVSLCGMLLHFISQTFSSNAICNQFLLNTTWPYSTDQQQDTLGELIKSTIIAIWELNRSSSHRNLNFMCVNLLTCICSAQLYKDVQLCNLPSSNLFMSFIFDSCELELRNEMKFSLGNNLHSTLAGKLVLALLANCTSIDKYEVNEINKMLTVEEKSNVISDIVMIIQQYIFPPFLKDYWFPSGSSKSLNINFDTTSILLFESNLTVRSCNLLVLLLFNRRSAVHNCKNPFREIFCLLQDNAMVDIEEDKQNHDSLLLTTSNRIFISFKNIIRGRFFREYQSESGLLLCYSFLHTHPAFTEIVSVSGMLHDLLVPLLKTLHRCTNQKYDANNNRPSNELYISVVCLLMIVQDCHLNSQLEQTICEDVTWCIEKKLKHYATSLLDLLLICILRTIVSGIFELCDDYLVSNCNAILFDLNLSSTLHPYVAERLIKITIQFGTKLISNKININSNAQDLNLSAKHRLILESYSSLIRLIGTAFVRGDKIVENFHIVQALVNDSEKLIRSLGDESLLSYLPKEVASLSASILGITRFVHGAVEEHCFSRGKEQGFDTVPSATAFLKYFFQENRPIIEDLFNIQLPSSSTSFFYQEGDNPEVYFLPLIWASIVRTCPEMLWSTSKFQLFNPEELEQRGMRISTGDYKAATTSPSGDNLLYDQV